MTRYILAALIGFCIGTQANLWQHPEPRALIHNAAQYVAREVSENGLPLPGWRGYRQGFREGQAAMLRVQLRDVEDEAMTIPNALYPSRRFTVEWTDTLKMRAEVEARSGREAIRLVRAGKFIERTLDSEPGEHLWHTATAIEKP